GGRRSARAGTPAARAKRALPPGVRTSRRALAGPRAPVLPARRGSAAGRAAGGRPLPALRRGDLRSPGGGGLRGSDGGGRAGPPFRLHGSAGLLARGAALSRRLPGPACASVAAEGPPRGGGERR